MFRLTKDEFTEVVANCDYLQNLKFRPTLPYAFTEQGVAMLAAVLNSQKAIVHLFGNIALPYQKYSIFILSCLYIKVH